MRSRRVLAASVTVVSSVCLLVPGVASAAAAPVAPTALEAPVVAAPAGDATSTATDASLPTAAETGVAVDSGPAATATATAAVAAAGAAVPAPLHRYSGPPEELARYVPQVSCDPVLRIGVSRLRDLLKTTYGGSHGPTTRSCDNGRTEHSDGRAYDWMLDASDPAEAADAKAFLDWLIGPDADGVAAGNARRLGVMYVIWDRKIWGSYNQQWKAYNGSSPHRDHVHLSLSWDGALGRTSFWSGATLQGHDYGPCQRYVGEAVPRYTARNPSPCPPPAPRPATPLPVSPAVGGVPLVGDWDGNGRDEVGLWKDGRVSLRLSSGEVRRYVFGRAGDVPVVGDWDGNGVDSVGVFRDGAWFLRNGHSAGGHDVSFRIGGRGDVPVVGRFNGRSLGAGVVTDKGRRWLLTDTLGGPVTGVFVFGRPGDEPVLGDWNGDGRVTPGVRRGSTRFLLGSWRVGPSTAVTLGRPEMVPFVGDFDGDGRTTLGVLMGGRHFAWRDDLRSGVATTTTTFTG